MYEHLPSNQLSEMICEPEGILTEFPEFPDKKKIYLNSTWAELLHRFLAKK